MHLNPNISETRDPAYLEPELRRRWELAFSRYVKMYPDLPEPFLVQTFRSAAYQDALYAQGRTTRGPIVTYVKGGGSFHNTFPATAFDIAFQIPNSQGGPWSRLDLFDKFAEIAMELDLEWGGSWKDFVDRPHFQVPRMSVKDVVAGKPIKWKPIPQEGIIKNGDIKFDRVFMVKEGNVTEEVKGITAMSIVGDKLYIRDY